MARLVAIFARKIFLENSHEWVGDFRKFRPNFSSVPKPFAIYATSIAERMIATKTNVAQAKGSSECANAIL